MKHIKKTAHEHSGGTSRFFRSGLSCPWLVFMAAAVAGCELDAPPEFGEYCPNVDHVLVYHADTNAYVACNKGECPEYDMYYLQRNRCPGEYPHCVRQISGEEIALCSEPKRAVPEDVFYYCADACPEHTHLAGGKCVEDTCDVCGAAGLDCKSLAGWKDGRCVSGQCVVTQCRDTYITETEPQTGQLWCRTRNECCGDLCLDCTHTKLTAEEIEDLKANYSKQYQKYKDNHNNQEPTVDDIYDLMVCITSSTDTLGKCELGCTDSTILCDGTCIDPMTSQSFCGASSTGNQDCVGGTECKSDQICQAGDCICLDEAKTKCDGACVDILSHVNHCGDCSNDCTQNPHWISGVCAEGVCMAETCELGFHPDNGVCVEDTIDACGSISNNCKETMQGWMSGKCINAKCVAESCQDGYDKIDDQCARQCGGSQCVPARVENSEQVECVENTNCVPVKCIEDYVISPDGKKCEPFVCIEGQTKCTNATLYTCRKNSWGSGDACTTSLSHANGTCKTLTACGNYQCESGYTDCGSTCVDLTSNASHCGECNNKCQVDYAQNRCENSSCQFTCQSDRYDNGRGTCDVCKDGTYRCQDNASTLLGVVEQCINGSWVTVHTCTTSCYGNDCGDCKNNSVECRNSGTVGQTRTCSNGTWGSYSDCLGPVSCYGNTCGECTDGDSDCYDSGTLGRIRSCSGGRWGSYSDCNYRYSCNSNGTLCGNCTNGDTQCTNSGSVGKLVTCNYGAWGSEQTCPDSGVCQNGSTCGCKSGKTRCNGYIFQTCSSSGTWSTTQECRSTLDNGVAICDEVNGCRTDCPSAYPVNCGTACVDTSSDKNNCGSCGHVCSTANATSTRCNSSECKPSCNTGFTDCSGICVNTKSDRNNCGGCGKTCGSNQACDNGTCVEATCGDGKIYRAITVSGSTTYAYCINSETTLKWVRDAINNGNGKFPASNTDNAYILTKDISGISASAWTPIGTDAHPFTGKLYGDFRTISFTGTMPVDGDDKGFFGYLSGAFVTELTLNLNLSVNGNYKNIGTFAGQASSSTLEAITVNTTISSTATDDTNNNIGGLIGSVYNTTIRGASVTGTVAGNKYVGGIVGYLSSGLIEWSHFDGTVIGGNDYPNNNHGGIAGFCSGTINNSYSSGKINKGYFAGGISGFGYSSCNITNSHSSMSVGGTGILGGLVGFLGGTISNSYATGNVSGGQNVGGLVGSGEGDVSDCYASGNVTGRYGVGGFVGIAENGASFTRCGAFGDVSAQFNIGGFVGSTLSYFGFSRTGGATFTNCYALGTVSATGTLNTSSGFGGFVGYTTGTGNLDGTITYPDTFTKCYSLSEGISSSHSSYEGGFVGVIGDKSVEANSKINSSYYNSASSPGVGHEVSTISINPQLTGLIIKSNTAYLQNGSTPLINALGSGWTSKTCTIKVNGSASNVSIPVSTTNVPASCH